MTEFNDTHADPAPREFTGKHMLFIMLGFFGIIISVNVGMAVLASSTWTGLVVKNSYVASQQFNGHLVASRLQEKLGWQGTLSYKNGAVEFILLDKESRPINLDMASVKIGRPAFEQKDQTIVLVKTGAGTYRADVALEEGPWAFSLHAKIGDQPYRLETRIDVSAAEASKSGN